MEFPSHLKKSMLATLMLTIVFVAAWEYFLRSKGFPIGYNEDNAAWANARSKVDFTKNQTVIIGSSRVKFDIDLPVFEQESGTETVQLALEGTNPLPVLHHLANDTTFRSTLLVGITEGLFFSISPRAVMDADARLKYYSKWSPAQKGSFRIAQTLESGFLFLDPEAFGLNSLLKRLPIDNRKGVWVFPNFPLSFAFADINRQTKMTNLFVTDTAEHRKMQTVWTKLGMLDSKKGVTGDTLTNIFKTIKQSTDKIKARGGKVYFVRCPSTGPVWEAEQKAHPRAEFWDALLAYTNCEGIHFTDYPTLSKFDCPEWSHITPEDAKLFTKELVTILKEKKLLSTSQN